MPTAATMELERTDVQSDQAPLSGATSGVAQPPVTDRNAEPSANTAGALATPALEKRSAVPSAPDQALVKSEAKIARDLFYNNKFEERLRDKGALSAEAQLRVDAEYHRLESADPERRLERFKGATFDRKQREYYQVSLRDQAVAALSYELLTPGHRPDDDRVRFHLTAKHSPHDVAVPADFKAATGKDLYDVLRQHPGQSLGGLRNEDYEQLQRRTGRPDVEYLARQFRAAEVSIRYTPNSGVSGTHRIGELLALVHDAGQFTAFEQALSAEYTAHGEQQLFARGLPALLSRLPQREQQTITAQIAAIKNIAPGADHTAAADVGGAAEAPQPEEAATDPQAAAVPLKHTVTRGDRVANLAAQYGVTVEEICAANGIELQRGVRRGGRVMDFALIRPGQELIIPGRSVPSEELAEGSEPPSSPAPATEPELNLGAMTFTALQLTTTQQIEEFGPEVAAAAKVGDFLLSERVAEGSNAAVHYFVAKKDEVEETASGSGIYKFKSSALASR